MRLYFTREVSPMTASTPLLNTKLFIPPARPNLVSRPRLHARLRAGLSGKLTLITAPAGFGKTTLLVAWLHQNDEQRRMNDEELRTSPHPSSFIAHRFRVAWLSLDAGDSDPVRFWSYVIAALETILPGIAATPLGMLQSPQPPPIEVVLTTLLNNLAVQGMGDGGWGMGNEGATIPPPPSPIPCILVLDDYHTIDAPTVHLALAM